MKIAIIAIIAFALSLTRHSFANPNADTYSLTVEVKNLRNAKGIVQFSLYNKEGSIPDKDYKNYYKILKGEIIDGSSTIILKIFQLENMQLISFTMKMRIAKLTEGLFCL
jgi:uncharacterized protein (DUF2141 family)